MADLLARVAVVILCLAVLAPYAIGVFDVFCWFYSGAQCSAVDWLGNESARIWMMVALLPIAGLALAGLFTALEG